MAEKIAGATDAAVVDATGQSWAACFEVLDANDGADGTHRDRA